MQQVLLIIHILVSKKLKPREINQIIQDLKGGRWMNPDSYLVYLTTILLRKKKLYNKKFENFEM